MNYYYRDPQGREIGPLDLTTLAKFRVAGVVNGDTSIRAADSTDWKPCREIIADPQAAPVAPPPTTAPTAPAKSNFGQMKLILVALAAIAVLVFVFNKHRPENASHTSQALPNNERNDNMVADAAAAQSVSLQKPSASNAVTNDNMLAVLGALGAAMGSSSGQPSVGDAERVVIDWMNDSWKGLNPREPQMFRLVDIRKTNAQQVEKQGLPVYKLEFEAKLKVDRNKLGEFLVQEWKNRQEFQPLPGVPKVATKPMTKEDIELAIDRVIEQKLGSFEGAVSGGICFEKTENGWRPGNRVVVFRTADLMAQSNEGEVSWLVGQFFWELRDGRQKAQETAQAVQRMGSEINRLESLEKQQRQEVDALRTDSSYVERRARAKLQGAQIVNDARAMDHAIDQWVIEGRHRNGELVNTREAAKYLKTPWMDKDRLGNPYIFNTVGPNQIQISPATKAALGDALIDWASY